MAQQQQTNVPPPVPDAGATPSEGELRNVRGLNQDQIVGMYQSYMGAIEAYRQNPNQQTANGVWKYWNLLQDAAQNSQDPTAKTLAYSYTMGEASPDAVFASTSSAATTASPTAAGPSIGGAAGQPAAPGGGATSQGQVPPVQFVPPSQVSGGNVTSGAANVAGPSPAPGPVSAIWQNMKGSGGGQMGGLNPTGPGSVSPQGPQTPPPGPGSPPPATVQPGVDPATGGTEGVSTYGPPVLPTTTPSSPANWTPEAGGIGTPPPFDAYGNMAGGGAWWQNAGIGPTNQWTTFNPYQQEGLTNVLNAYEQQNGLPAYWSDQMLPFMQQQITTSYLTDNPLNTTSSVLDAIPGMVEAGSTPGTYYDPSGAWSQFFAQGMNSPVTVDPSTGMPATQAGGDPFSALSPEDQAQYVMGMWQTIAGQSVDPSLLQNGLYQLQALKDQWILDRENPRSGIGTMNFLDYARLHGVDQWL